MRIVTGCGLALMLLVTAVATTASAQVAGAPASPHGNLAVPCADCHSPDGWKPARISDRFDHGGTGFVLEGGHAAASCLSCHTSLDFKGVGASCANCHQDVHLGQLGATCADCHTPRSFTDPARMVRRHQLGRFPLEGPHLALACTQCHRPGSQGLLQYANVPTECSECHQVAFAATTNPDHVAAAFPKDCLQCHNPGTWTGGQFDHATTAYPLVGAHAAATCQDCHASKVFKGLHQACMACHVAAFNATTDPPHQQASFPADCTLCHTGLTSWTGAAFDHDAGRFPLVGAHRAVTCEACHASGTWAGQPTACASCHQAKFDATVSPDHQAAAFALTCTDCHTQTAWTGATFDHGTTEFPLTGAHLPVTCADCHAEGVYANRNMACFSCHQPDYDAVTTPNHRAASFPTDCTQCHTTGGFSGAAFDHGITDFPLTGAHLATTCLDCHAGSVYRGLSTTCISCHQPDYDATVQPDHRAAVLPTDCTLCHSTGVWGNTLFNHGSTQFPLTGVHVQAPCGSCHVNNTYAGTPTTCASCHLGDYGATTAPNHQASGLPTDCVQCHGTAAWAGAGFNHTSTRFPLTGAHLATTCLDCHGDGVYAGKPTSCFSCHQATYTGTTAPNHQAAGFPTDCAACHTAVRWPGAVFDHDASQFALTGAHRAVTCQDCHADGVYGGKPAACMSCHQPDYTGTTTPPHQSLSFPADCTQCHTTTAWPGGTYNHSTTSFPLTGAHIPTPCASCHVAGVYRGTPVTCLACHQEDYNATISPRHSTAQFPTSCTSCHTTTTWIGAQFNHDAQYFPVYSGKHRGKWSTCAECHTNNQNYAVFTCLSCHEHNQSKMDSAHQGRSGYSYTSTACLSCHPRGDE